MSIDGIGSASGNDGSSRSCGPFGDEGLGRSCNPSYGGISGRGSESSDGTRASDSASMGFGSDDPEGPGPGASDVSERGRGSSVRQDPDSRASDVSEPDASTVLQTAMASIFEHDLVPGDAPAGSPILLMVSGGSDSTAMCLLAHELVQDGFIDSGRIAVLHVNHGLRGDDSYNDSLFVKRLADLCGFPYELRYIDIYSQLEELGGNVESAGRYLRYEVADQLLDELCGEAGVDPAYGRIWVAHTQDDRVETFFMRAIVGTGPGGFATIRYSNGRIARPLLDTTREQLRAYIAQRVEALGWQLDSEDVAQVPGGLWREDATNYDTTGFRSFVRYELVPLAKQRNPSLGKTLSRTIDLITDENDAIEAHVDEAKSRAVRSDGNRTVLDIDEASSLERPFLRRLVYSTCKDVLPVGERIELKHVDIIMSSMSRPGFSMDLPGGVRVHHEYGDLVFECSDEASVPAACGQLDDEVELPVPGHVFLGMHIKVSVSRASCGGSADVPPLGNVEYAKRHSGDGTVFVDEGRVLAACKGTYSGDSMQGVHMLISHRQPGDVVCPLGMGGSHKKLSDIFVDKKVRRSMRDEVLVIRAGSSIVWVVGVVQDDRFKVSDGRPMLRIDVEGT